VTFVDDYAHLPTEVRSALEAARAGDWERVVAVFQPHRYSRTEQVGKDFGGSFDAADVLFLTDVYAAGEEPRPGVTGRLVEAAVLAAGHRGVRYVAERSELASAVASELRSGDLCISLGAGDITRLADEVQPLLRQPRP
jgi:UDP-N-acetylmuramate--alanine ligase